MARAEIGYAFASVPKGGAFGLCFNMRFDVKLWLLVYRPSTKQFIVTIGHDSVHIT